MISVKTDKSPYFNLQKTVFSHGWVNLKPFSWDNTNKRLHISLKLDGNNITGSLRQENKKQLIVFSSNQSILRGKHEHVKMAIRRILSLDQDVVGFRHLCEERKKTKYLGFIKAGWGRILRGSSAWEDAVKTICTTNASWAYTQQMCHNLCIFLGDKKVFPSPESIAKAGIKYLREKVVLGYRSEYIYNLAKRILNGELRLEELEYGNCSLREAEETVSSLEGFGPYASNHLLVLLGWHSVLPIDREVMKFLRIPKTKNGRCPRETKHYQQWGNYRFIAYKLDRIIARKNWIGD